MRIDYKLNLMVLLSTTILAVVLVIDGIIAFDATSRKNLDKAEDILVKNKVSQVKMMVDAAYEIASYDKDKNDLINKLSKVRYSGGSGYYFAYEKKGANYHFAFHGVKKSLRGKKTNLDKPDPKGFAFRRALIEAADKSDAGGVVEYHYKNPKTGVMSKKIAYARKVPKWNWYIVTGIYMDDIQVELNELERFSDEGERDFITTSIVASAVVLVIILVIVAFFVKRYSFKILDLTKKLAQLAGETKKVADVVSDRSHKFSVSTQEQASSLEESSASLEELDKMIQENMASSDQTNQAAEDVKNVSNDGNAAMREALVAIQNIIEGNKEIEELSKVIEEIGQKTSIIDDIVFQTKLLSFNASVEAERAGEHGRGFAVVAQEVGSLAELSGKAAQEISTIVKSSVTKANAIVTDNQSRVSKGHDLVGNAAGKLNEIETSAGSVSEQVSNIVSASKEQSIGISQINEAVSHLDKAVQENSQNADDVAAVGKELVEFANNLSTIAIDLDVLMSGKRKV